MEGGITVITDIPDDIAYDKLNDAATFIMEDVNVIIQNGGIEAYHRIGKSDKKASTKKILFYLLMPSIVRKH